jgi:hypothetical protein
MMGDEMAVRSGGMYGNPESSFTNAMPSSSFGGAGTVFSGMGQLLNMWGTAVKHKAEMKQLRNNQRLLELEKQYNLENFQQKIADTVAENKMSFYSSGLDIAGSAQDVITSNRRALEKDMGIMQRNYDVQIENLQRQQKAKRIGFGIEQAVNAVNFVGSVI